MSPTAGEPSPRRKLSVAGLALIVPWVALVIDAWGPIRDNSFLWHVRAGSAQAELATVLTVDPFSFTRNGTPWRTQSWLIELMYSWLESLSGLGFVPWMILSTTTLTTLGIGLIAFRESKSVPATAFVLVLSTLALLSFMVPRPVLFSYLLFVLAILAWDDRSLRWTVPFIFWIWASVHGSFALGLAFVGLRLLMQREWRALPTLGIAGLSTLVTAHGIGVAEMLLDFANARDSLGYLSEWRRPTLDSPVFLPFLGGLMFIGFGAVRKRLRVRHLWILIPFVALGFSSVRAIPPAWIAILPLVALSLSGLSLGSKPRLGVLPSAVFALTVLAMPLLLIRESAIDTERFPIAATQSLEEGRTFHDDRAGGYLIWAEWPDRLVYLDDRAELYGDRIREFVEIRAGDLDWQEVFERDGIQQVLLRTDEPIIEDLVRHDWVIAYEDDAYVVLRQS